MQNHSSAGDFFSAMLMPVQHRASVLDTALCLLSGNLIFAHGPILATTAFESCLCRLEIWSWFLY